MTGDATPADKAPVLAGRRLRISRASQQIAAELRGMILYGSLSDRAQLPPEAEFAAQLGVSRHHLREALRLLERDGLVRVRAGRKGGIFLAVPDVDVLTRAFSGILARTGATLPDLMAARLVIEPGAAALAAEHATAAELDEIAALVERQAALGYYERDLNRRFHLAVAAGAHNQTLLLMLRSIADIIEIIDVELSRGRLNEESVRAHRAIVRALYARDSARAADLMRRHLLGFVERLRQSGVAIDALRVADLLQASEGAKARSISEEA